MRLMTPEDWWIVAVAAAGALLVLAAVGGYAAWRSHREFLSWLASERRQYGHLDTAEFMCQHFLRRDWEDWAYKHEKEMTEQ
jgi:hypothetical protein